MAAPAVDVRRAGAGMRCRLRRSQLRSVSPESRGSVSTRAGRLLSLRVLKFPVLRWFHAPLPLRLQRRAPDPVFKVLVRVFRHSIRGPFRPVDQYQHWPRGVFARSAHERSISYDAIRPIRSFARRPFFRQARSPRFCGRPRAGGAISAGVMGKLRHAVARPPSCDTAPGYIGPLVLPAASIREGGSCATERRRRVTSPSSLAEPVLGRSALRTLPVAPRAVRI